MASSVWDSLGLRCPDVRCVCAHTDVWVHTYKLLNTFQAHIADKCVLYEELEDPLIVTPPESSRNPFSRPGRVHGGERMGIHQ